MNNSTLLKISSTEVGIVLEEAKEENREDVLVGMKENSQLETLLPKWHCLPSVLAALHITLNALLKAQHHSVIFIEINQAKACFLAFKETETIPL